MRADSSYCSIWQQTLSMIREEKIQCESHAKLFRLCKSVGELRGFSCPHQPDGKSSSGPRCTPSPVSGSLRNESGPKLALIWQVELSRNQGCFTVTVSRQSSCLGSISTLHFSTAALCSLSNSFKDLHIL